MCGIAGSINLTFDVPSVLNALRHRGPDDQQAVSVDNIQLLHVRLSIIDRAGGAQPMTRGHLTIVYNGEIYNHMALRSRFGLSCHTGSDTETLLALYEKLGLDCFQYLDGMFAIALYDSAEKALFLVRDRAGEKPLYCYKQGSGFAFASELNALRKIVPAQIDVRSINQYLNAGFFYQAQTPYLDVSEIRPGHVVRVDTNNQSVQEWPWFSVESTGHDNRGDSMTEEKAVADLDAALHKAIEDRLLSSDLEVGCFLSGGIDSGLVTAIASAYTKKLKTFTVSFDGQFDEAPLARQVANLYNTEHTDIQIGYDDLDQNIESILTAYGEPICDDSVVPSWYVSRAAKEHVTVVMTGDGADELYAGYRRYVPYAHMNLFSSQPTPLQTVLGQFARLPAAKNKMSRYNYLHRMASLLRQSGPERFLAAMVNVDSHSLLERELNPAFVDAFEKLAALPDSSLTKMMRMDFHSLLAGSLLPKMDIASMAHALETRTPFFSDELFKHAAALPDNLKIRGTTTKYLLRALAQKYLPADVVSAPKRGFETPLTNWVDGVLKERICDTLTGNTFVSQFYRPGAINQLINHESTISHQQRARTLWMLFATELWARTVR